MMTLHPEVAIDLINRTYREQFESPERRSRRTFRR